MQPQEFNKWDLLNWSLSVSIALKIYGWKCFSGYKETEPREQRKCLASKLSPFCLIAPFRLVSLEKSFIKVNGQIFQGKIKHLIFGLSTQTFSSLLDSPQDSNLQAELHKYCQLWGWLCVSGLMSDWQSSGTRFTCLVSGNSFTEASGRPEHITGTFHK